MIGRPATGTMRCTMSCCDHSSSEQASGSSKFDRSGALGPPVSSKEAILRLLPLPLGCKLSEQMISPKSQKLTNLTQNARKHVAHHISWATPDVGSHRKVSLPSFLVASAVNAVDVFDVSWLSPSISTCSLSSIYVYSSLTSIRVALAARRSVPLRGRQTQHVRSSCVQFLVRCLPRGFIHEVVTFVIELGFVWGVVVWHLPALAFAWVFVQAICLHSSCACNG